MSDPFTSDGGRVRTDGMRYERIFRDRIRTNEVTNGLQSVGRNVCSNPVDMGVLVFHSATQRANSGDDSVVRFRNRDQNAFSPTGSLSMGWDYEDGEAENAYYNPEHPTSGHRTVTFGQGHSVVKGFESKREDLTYSRLQGRKRAAGTSSEKPRSFEVPCFWYHFLFSHQPIL